MKDPIRDLCVDSRLARLLLASLLFWLPLAAAAEQVPTTIALEEELDMSDLPADAGGLGLEREGDAVELTLEDAIALTLKRNLSLVVERYRRSQSIQGVEAAFGIFDLGFGTTFLVSEDSRPITSELEGSDTLDSEAVVLNFDLTQLTAFGGTAALSFNNNRVESSNPFATPNPQFTVDFDLSYTQPLLRNFGRDVTRNDILVAQNNSAISREIFQAEVETVVQQVSDRYWLLVEAREQLKVAEESLSLAKELHEMNRIQVEVGTMAPLETVRSEAGVATREEEIIRRTAAVEDAADFLRRFLNLDRARYWDIEIVPVTDPITGYVDIDFDAAYATALEKRTDVATQRLFNANRALAAELAANQKKPRLDLTAGYGLNGVSGDVIDPQTMMEISGGWGDALEQVLDAESDGWFLQAIFAFPIQNRTAKARLLQAELDFKQGEVEMLDLEQQIESSKVSTKLERKNLEAEQKRYENGLSTSFEVLQIQEDLTEALSREVTAITTYRRALNALYFATGEILEKVGVELVDGE